MSARAPRRSFATPFVLTLAALPTACAVQTTGSSGPSGPPPREHQHVHSDMQDHPPPGHEQPQPAEQPSQPMTPVANPPRPDAPASNTGVNAQVGQTANPGNAGVEQQSRPNLPPPPAKPAAYREWTVSRQSGKCSSMVKVHCPEGAMCNPPPPAKYTCPKFMADGDRIDVVQRAEKAECFVDYGEPSCPPGASCNPPRPQKVTCPK